MKALPAAAAVLASALVLQACGVSSSSSDGAALEDGDTITVIVPTDPGGGYDLAARTLQPYLEDALNKVAGVDVTVEVENMPGAGTQVGVEHAWSSEPDGRTLLFSGVETGASLQVVEGANFKFNEFTWLAQYSRAGRALIVSKDLKLPQDNFAGVVERSQEEPILWGNAGNHTSFLLLQAVLENAGIDLAVDEVVVDGNSSQIAALLRGDIEVAWVATKSALEAIEANPDLKLLVTTDCEPDPAAPDAPTILEGAADPEAICGEGAPSLPADIRAFSGPPGIPADTVAVLDEALKMAITNSEHVSTMKSNGEFIDYHSAEETSQLANEKLAIYEKYADTIK